MHRAPAEMQGAPADRPGHSSPSPGVSRSDGALLQFAALPLGETTPDPEALVVHQCRLQALVAYLTREAHLLGLSRRPTLLRKERFRVGLRAQRAILPTHVLGARFDQEELSHRHRPLSTPLVSTLVRRRLVTQRQRNNTVGITR